MNRPTRRFPRMSIQIVSPVNREARPRPVFYVVSLRKLIILNFFTGGLYWFFWFLRNWDLYRRSRGPEFSMLPGVLWPEFFVYMLLNRVDRQIRVTGRDYAWSPWWLAFFMVLMLLLSATVALVSVPISDDGLLISASLLTGVLYYVTLCKAQQAINYCEVDPYGEGNAQLTLVNWLWIIGCTLGWLMLD